MTYDEIKKKAKRFFVDVYKEEWEDRYYIFIGQLMEICEMVEEDEIVPERPKPNLPVNQT